MISVPPVDVIPAKAGTDQSAARIVKMGPDFRRDDKGDGVSDAQTTLALPHVALLADELASEEMVEMANLTEAQTGVPGTILISSTMGTQGPCVRYSEQPGLAQVGFTVSIADLPTVTAPTAIAPPNSADLLKVAPQVVQWVLRNKSALLDFWHHGDTWTQPAVNEFVQQLQRVDMSGEAQLYDLHRKSRHNQSWLSESATCGCYYCLKEFSFDQIKWNGKSDTALCPFCGIDTVIGFDIQSDDNQDVLQAMRNRWLGSSYRFVDDVNVSTPTRDVR